MTDVPALPAGETVQMECYETDDGLVVQTVGAIDEWMQSRSGWWTRMRCRRRTSAGRLLRPSWGRADERERRPRALVY